MILPRLPPGKAGKPLAISSLGLHLHHRQLATHRRQGQSCMKVLFVPWGACWFSLRSCEQLPPGSSCELPSSQLQQCARIAKPHSSFSSLPCGANLCLVLFFCAKRLGSVWSSRDASVLRRFSSLPGRPRFLCKPSGISSFAQLLTYAFLYVELLVRYQVAHVSTSDVY